MKRHHHSFVLPLAVSLTVTVGISGCAKADPQPAPGARTDAPAHSAAQTTAPGVGSGVVLETMDAGSYTYVHVNMGDHTVWAAAPQFQVAVGDTVMVPPGSPMKDFYSQSMDRTFETIYFVGQIQVQGAGAATQMPPGHPPVAQPQTAGAETAAVEKLDKPAGGHTIAEVFANKAELGGQTVTVRGKVVKANMGILGANWYHIQDGSGSAGEGTHDLTLTSPGTASVGQVVTAVGTLTLDKDFGAGYRYDVILTDATVTPQ